MIVIENVSKKYGDKQVLNNFSYVFPDKGFVAINGSSGIGKTTLLKIILGLELPDAGSVKFVNAEQPDKKMGRTSGQNTIKISAVFQEDRLLENDTVLENVLLVMDEKKGLKKKDLKKKGRALVKSENLEKAKKILTELGLEKEFDEKVSNLSGGMKRRVAIARCLAVDAPVYIMDEPIKGLDVNLSARTLELIHKYTDGNNRLLIMVSHNPEEYSECTDRILLLNG